MRLSQRGAGLLIKREGERFTAYQCSAGKWTIGIGHVAPWVKEGVTISREKSRSLFSEDIVWAEDAVNKHVDVEINQDQFDCLVSFVFNIGTPAFKSSTLLRELNKGNYDAVPHQLSRWNKVTINGKKVTDRILVNRRRDESDQWLESSYHTDNVRPTPSEPESPKATEVMKRSKTVRSGAATAGIGGLGAVTQIMNTVGEATEATSNLFTYGAIVGCVLLVAIGSYIVYNRVKDSRDGRAY